MRPGQCVTNNSRMRDRRDAARGGTRNTSAARICQTDSAVQFCKFQVLKEKVRKKARTKARFKLRRPHMQGGVNSCRMLLLIDLQRTSDFIDFRLSVSFYSAIVITQGIFISICP